MNIKFRTVYKLKKSDHLNRYGLKYRLLSIKLILLSYYIRDNTTELACSHVLRFSAVYKFCGFQ